MLWDEYVIYFTHKAVQANYSPKDIDYCLKYAKNIYDRGFPIIFDLKHFSLITGCDQHYLYAATNVKNSFYRYYSIPKRNGGLRPIAEPLPDLKRVQRWIVNNILSRMAPHPTSTAFHPNCNIINNATPHLCKRMVLSLDVENFFNNITYKKVYEVFMQTGYDKPIVTSLSNLCTLDDVLPQGAPTSPYLSNLVCLPIDKRLCSFANKFGVNYTRYADDVTFSGVFHPGKFVRFTDKVLHEYGLSLNDNKTRLMERHQAQEVTGIVVNAKLQVKREIRRGIRQAGYYINKYGFDNHMAKINITKANYVSHLLGIASHILNVCPTDRDALFIKEIFKTK